MVIGQFNIDSLTVPTNKDVVLVFSPYSNVVSYTYYVYKNDSLVSNVNITNNNSCTINLSDTGTYKVVISANLVNGFKEEFSSGYYIIDKEKPIINLEKKEVQLYKGQNFDVSKGVTASDNYDGNITSKVTSNYDKLDLTKAGNYKLTYTVNDQAGNVNHADVNITVAQGHFMVIQLLIIVSILTILYFFNRFRKAFKLEKRLEPFIIKPFNSKELSLFDKVTNYYHKLLAKLNKIFEKSELAKKYASSFEKYVVVSRLHESGMDIVSGKFIIALLFVLIAIITKVFGLKIVNIYEISLIFILGFFVLDILFITKYKFFKWKLESDFIAAITIMNNAFKSGRSITQAIDIVSNEVKGVIGREFNKMSLELLYGLEMEVVFKRFAERIQLEEANYLTASLTILNKTGGNIIQIFSSIEKNMFNKRKLRLELSSLTSGSKIVVFVLLAMPFFFVFVVSIINPSYFLPFVTTNLGIMLLLFMIIYYIIFVVIVRKIMKVTI